jgi:hypothetical protein
MALAVARTSHAPVRRGTTITVTGWEDRHQARGIFSKETSTMTTTSSSCLTSSSESAQIFLKHIDSIPADERCYQIFMHLEENTNGLSRAVQVIEQSGANLQSITILSSPVQHRRIVVLRFADRDLKNVLIDLIQSGYLEVKGCGPRLVPEPL